MSAAREPRRGDALARKLQKLGLRSRMDFVLHLPLRYEDETALVAPADAPAGKPVLVEAKLQRAEIAYRPRRQLVVHAEGLVLRFFNFYGSQLRQFQRGVEEGLLVRAYGEVRGGWFGAEMAHPRYRLVRAGEPLPSTLTPVYSTTAGVSQAAIRARVLEALDEGALADSLPAWLRARYHLAGFAESVSALHRPAPGVDLSALAERTHPAWRRMKFDELLAQQLSMRFAYRERRSRSAPPLPSRGPLVGRFLARLPFRLTSAQTRALDEVLADLATPHPMQRLLQGDVGSGKTIVAALACLTAVDARWQAALMAPTEILSEQHYRKFRQWLEAAVPGEVRVAWLHGGLAKAEKKSVLEDIRSGAAQVVIGTHALVQEGVDFARLGLAIVDEQHRFGVEQRVTLRRKGTHRAAGLPQPVVPHQLMMSATPIPRTLSMTYYADLDVSTLDELPPGRKPVATRLVSASRRAEVLERIREACAEGQQAYWVCPVVEESREGAQTAIDTHAKLAAELRGIGVGLLHGRLAQAEKAATMKAFAAGEIQLLVCTTVIEVGVDVPNASLMVIESAERFGLAQLHQLRGRVGRGARESVCILLFEQALSSAGRERLRVMYENSDGFEIARLDLKLRGPGEYLGERQSGAPLLRFADLERDAELVDAARAAAAELLESEPQAAARHAARWLASRAELLSA
ncbi:MAG: ATP-dependent DNA helicase RecG [Betaproteobacteria bacterium]|nr:ATP-dependent DNA helicase RecG [Betaproteobacteria bacterium]